MKKGGVLCIVHKSAVWPKWEAKQEKLVADKVWEKVWINKDPVSPVENVALSYLLEIFGNNLINTAFGTKLF